MKIKGLRKKKHYAIKGCHVKAQIKDVDTTKRVVTGFYNTYNFVDSQGDILMPGCADKTITERGPNSSAVAKIKHALNHNITQLPGKIITLKEATINGLTGIYFETRMADTTLGNDTLKNYLEQVYDNHSIGFRYMDYQYIERGAHGNSKMSDLWKQVEDSCINPDDLAKLDSVILVKEIKMFEGSTVAFGANELTPYLGVKSGNKEAYALMLFDRINNLERVLKTGTQTDDTLADIEIMCLQLKEMMREFTKHLRLPGQPKKQKAPENIQPEKNFTNIASYLKQSDWRK